MNTDLPYIVEYAKSNRASCKLCREKIDKESLRVGIMVQSPHFDGKIPMWHHLNCFLKKKIKPKEEEIANFDNLKWEDQKKMKDCFEKSFLATPSTSKTKNGKGEKVETDFSVDYAKTSRSSCKHCFEKINKGELRISKLVTDSPEAMRFGPAPGWHHVDCFVKVRLELQFTDSADSLPGFNNLTEEDQNMLKDKLMKLGVKRKADTVAVTKKPKLDKEEKALKAQSDLLFSMRDQIKHNLSKQEMIDLLKYNNQHISVGEQNLRDNLSDLLVFGAIKECPECKTSTPRFKLDAYRCSGNLTEWTKCQFVTMCPERCEFKIPEEFKEQFDFLRDYKYVKRDRILKKKGAVTSEKKGPLFGYLFVIMGKLQVNKATVEAKIFKLGGEVASKVTPAVTCCISTEGEIQKQKKNKQIELLRMFDIHVVTFKFVEDVEAGSSIAIAVKENCISSWGGDPIVKFGIKQENALKKEENEKKSNFSMKSSTLKISSKGGVAVDPDSGMASKCHVYQNGKNIYNAVLNKVDVSKGMNSYYKMQILKSNKSNKYYLFRAWGRVGTTIGGNKLDSFGKVEDAITEFESHYFEKTKNYWSDRENFVKKPDSMYPLDVDYGQDLEQLPELKPGDNSLLPKPVQDLICLIFDIEMMKKAMVEFEIDLNKMPMGKLTKKQIQMAYSVLNEVQQILLTGSNATKILDATNRFYTLIPHDFGLKQPPLLDNEELITSKLEMLDSLLEIEFAYKLLHGDKHTSTKDPVDEHYEKLKTDIEVLDTKSEEFQIIATYMKNTHADTHKQYELILNNVFKISRHGESERYQKFKNLHNKKLLWHGSRLTNFVGILSQGLRIAPPEAPASGYMFGKGVYFADMVSKSANYCFTSKSNPRGLLLLSEVALGNMHEKPHAENIVKPPNGKHSVKGLGMTVPDPKTVSYIDGVEVPLGKATAATYSRPTSLLYNEYIVYDVNQVNIRYLLDVKFKWKF